MISNKMSGVWEAATILMHQRATGLQKREDKTGVLKSSPSMMQCIEGVDNASVAIDFGNKRSYFVVEQDRRIVKRCYAATNIETFLPMLGK